MQTTQHNDPLLRLESGGTEIWLIRHGDALRGPEEVADGGYDEQGLSILGRRQAAALSAALASIAIDAVYASPAPRAFETAQAVAAPHGLAVITDAAVREVDLATLRPIIAPESTPEERAAQLRHYLRWMEQRALAIGVWDDILEPGASAAIRTRISTGVDAIAARHAGQRVVIASHAGAINAYIATFLGMKRDFFFPIANTSVSVVRVLGDSHLLVRLNDTAHFAGADLSRGGQPR